MSASIPRKSSLMRSLHQGTYTGLRWAINLLSSSNRNSTGSPHLRGAGEVDRMQRRAGSSDSRGLTVSYFCTLVFERRKAKFGMVVCRDKMEKLVTRVFLFLLFLVLEMYFFVFFLNFRQLFNRSLLHEKKNRKDQTPVFSSCSDAQPCEISFSNSQKPLWTVIPVRVNLSLWLGLLKSSKSSIHCSITGDHS